MLPTLLFPHRAILKKRVKAEISDTWGDVAFTYVEYSPEIECLVHRLEWRDLVFRVESSPLNVSCLIYVKPSYMLKNQSTQTEEEVTVEEGDVLVYEGKEFKVLRVHKYILRNQTLALELECGVSE